MTLLRFCAVMLLPITWSCFRCLIPSDFVPWCYFRLLDDISDSAWSYFRFRAVMILPFAWSLPISRRDATSDYLMIFPIVWSYFRFRAVMLLLICVILLLILCRDILLIAWCYFRFCSVMPLLIPTSDTDATSVSVYWLEANSDCFLMLLLCSLILCIFCSFESICISFLYWSC